MSEKVNVPPDNAQPVKRRPTRVALAGLLFLLLAVGNCSLGCRWYCYGLAPLTVAMWVLAVTCTVVAVYLCKRRGIHRNDGIYQLAASTLIGCMMAFLMGPAVIMVLSRSEGMRVTNQFKVILFAMHEYADENPQRRLPPAAKRDEGGKPLLSWRVLLLPKLGHRDLYDRFHLDEPWDSPHNLQLLPLMPEVYRIARRSDPPNSTAIQVFVGPGTPFEIVEGPILSKDFPDGTYNTILIAEASTAVLWTKPQDIEYDPNGPLPSLGDVRPLVWPSIFCCRDEQYLVGLGDASVRLVWRQISESTLRNAITRNDGEPLGKDW